jgi:large conductance mechanosensitive channel
MVAGPWPLGTEADVDMKTPSRKEGGAPQRTEFRRFERLNHARSGRQPAILLDPHPSPLRAARRRDMGPLLTWATPLNCPAEKNLVHGTGDWMSILKEFREFAVKGNVIDLAVGIIIGAAFGKIVDSLVKDVVMPMINALAGGAVDFSNKYWVLSGNVAPGSPLDAAQKTGVVFAWGNFITVLLNFIILAFVIFWMVKAVNRVKSRLDAAAAAPPEDVLLLREIRDELKKR